MYIVIGILAGIIILQFIIMWKYQRQVKDICRQLAFLMKHDSNMLIQREFDLGGIGTLSDRLNELLELQRKEKQRYQEKEALIADTYTNLSHDIRTPLTSLDGYFQLMEECENVEDQRRYLNIIHERIHSLNEMLEELFTFTKLKNESYSLELTPCCINRILKETVFSYYDEWVRMEIQPDIQITEEQLYIHGNRQGLRRVIQNVIKNGLDHGEKKISIVLERDQNQAVLRISNQVTHPEQINIDQVFERFYKADVARSKTSTGLGLSIAKELVKRMNGEISAKTEKNEFIIEQDQGVFSIKGKRVEKLIAMTDFDNPVSLRRFERAWKFMGLDKLLKKEGIQEGDTVNLYGVEFSFSDKKGCSDIPGESEGKSC